MSRDVQTLDAALDAFRAGAFRTASDRLQQLVGMDLSDGLHLKVAQLMAQTLECEGVSGVLSQRRFREYAPVQHLAEGGTILSGIGRHDQAIALLDHALAREPTHAPSLYFRGTLAMFSGDMERSRSLLERAISADPRFAQSYWALSMLPLEPDARRVERVRAGLASAMRGYTAEVYFGFALFNELHAMGSHGPAWSALTAACIAKRKQLRYSPDRQQSLFDALETWPVSRPQSEVQLPNRAYRPVFIVGMHRSGTTLLESLLAGHPQVADGGESYSFTVEAKYLMNRQWDGVVDAEAIRWFGGIAPSSLQRLAERYRERNGWRAAQRAVLTEKLPSNVLVLGPIAEALPEALFLHVRRDAVETCFSNFRTLFSTACGYSYDIQELAAYYRGYERLMARWRSCYGARILDIDFERLTREPDLVMRDVERFLGLASGGSGCAEGQPHRRTVTSASAVQVRSAIAPRTPAATSYPMFVETLRRCGIGGR